MLKLDMYTFLLGLLIAFLLVVTAGCGQQNTPRDKPDNSSVKTQQGENPKQKQAEPAPKETPDQHFAGKTGTLNRQPDNSPSEQTGVAAQEIITATVTRVVDGDTVVVELTSGSEEKLRLIGVNTPESTKKVEPYGKESSAYTQSRLDGRKVWLELDAGERDRYGRLLAYIWMEKPASDSEAEVQAKMFNAELLISGYAQVMTVPPNVKYADLFVKLQREAREADKGLWGLAGEKKPSE